MRATIALTIVLNEAFVRARAARSGRTEDEVERELVTELDLKAREALIWSDAVRFIVDADVVSDDRS